MEERVKKIMAEAFSVNVSEINENTSPETMPQWDSFGHLHLVRAIEHEFGITIGDNQITQMISFRLVVEMIRNCQQS
jgi:acyl carrier protein